MMGKAAIVIAKALGVLLICMTCSVGIIGTVLMLALEAVGRLALQLVRSPFAKSGGLLAALFGGAVWFFVSAIRG